MRGYSADVGGFKSTWPLQKDSGVRSRLPLWLSVKLLP